jgi:type IV pilus assembly protein PilA
MKNMCLAFTTFALAACGGGSTPPDLTKPAIAEAMTTLEAAKPVIDRAYRDNGRAFPLSANAPISTAAPANAKYISAVSYNAGSATASSVVLTLTGTGNSIVDGAFVGVFGTGQSDGNVRWVCGTSASASQVSAPAARTEMYPYLPPRCQH